MKMYRVDIDDATKHLFELVDAAIRGEAVLIVKEDEQIVQLVPVKQTQRAPHFGSAKGLIVIADDFDAPLEDFNGYLL